ncbi:MAG: methyltransferase domain-containing protein [Betaproteobacteria bacterium]|nr:MAG: methyltransferase domain-containing protein [Betaproteobacteria bacterium]
MRLGRVATLSLTALAMAAGIFTLAHARDGAGTRIHVAQAAAPARTPDVIYVPTPQAVVDEMLKVAKVKKGDVLYDLGSGDGRIVITAAKRFGIRGIGIDIDPQRIAEANENARKQGVSHLVTFKQTDLFTIDISEATVVTLYLLPRLNVKLRPKLFSELKNGTRIVSHAFDMAEWEPEKHLKVDGRDVYFWTINDSARAKFGAAATEQK